jgi:hypothetical protein
MALLAGCTWLLLVGAVQAEVTPGEPVDAVTARLDALFEQSWREAGLKPAAVVDDARFLRRVTLDLTGLIPTVGDIRTFLADARPDKRHRAIASLLERPRHSGHLARLWRDVLLPRNTDETAAAAFEDWLRTRFQQNAPYDRVVREILTAQGSVGQSEPALFVAANSSKPEELAASSSRAFLGLQVRCAQCHDHPFAPWKQTDFWSFAAFFARVQGPASPADRTPVADRADGEVRHPKTLKVLPPRFLDGEDFSGSSDEPRRVVLARWVTAADNPYFARAAVNRAWWLLFGRGLVQPVDDLGSHNPATHPEVLDLLGSDFVASGFDLRRTIAIIAGSKPYQLEGAASGGESDVKASYGAMPVRSLTARQVYDAILLASGQREAALEATGERQAFLSQFEAPTREPLEYQGGIPQILTLLNGPLVTRLTDPATGDLIAALSDSPFLTNEKRVETLFLATLSRMPRDDEREQTRKIMQSKRTDAARAKALGDILWALLNSSEFVLNH